MKRFTILASLLFLGFTSSKAQIVVNGRSTYRPYFNNAKSGISISYGTLMWQDSKQKQLDGYSEPVEGYVYGVNDIGKFNYNASLRFGYEKGISEKFSIKTYLLTGKLYTGLLGYDDSNLIEKSKVFQISTYGNLFITRTDRRLKVSFMLGPEFMLVNKNVLIHSFKTKSEDIPDDYNLRESIFEIGLTTGLGFSYDINNHFSLFSDGLLGFSLPGGGFKITNTGIGIKYFF